DWKGTAIRLIDTPGHTDFSAEIERSFWALDAAVLLVDAAQGVQPQTETLFRALKEQGLPFLFFLNKTDRPEADPQRVLEQIRKRLSEDICPLWDEDAMAEYVCGKSDDLTIRYLEGEPISQAEIRERLSGLTAAGESFPVLYGSALKDLGIPELLDAMVAYLPGPETSGDELCGVAFAVSRDRILGRGLWVRLFGGKLENRMALEIQTGTDRITGEPVFVQRKISQIRNADGEDVGRLSAGDVAVVYGLGDPEVGYVFGRPEKLPRKVQPGLLKTPLLMVRVIPDRTEETQQLWEACSVLSSEDPLLQAQYTRTTGEILLQIMGKVQLEIIQETLESRFGLKASFGDPAVIYRETLRERTTGFAAYTMPKPCWAILEFDLEPGPRGSGITYASNVPARDILPRYQHQVEQALPRALSHGRLGWQVTDVKITLTGGNHHPVHTHPLDFIVATPMAIQDGLRRGGSVLLEPILEMRFTVPSALGGRIISDVQQMRGEVTDTAADEETVTLKALVPAASSMDYPTQFASLTGGRGSMSTSLHGYRECPMELGHTAPRRGVDPLDTAKYILAARNALEGEIY
nr:TetM/TetW/TetO/TetS family tetracycline resistance ribosomal protection protein [Clostridiales bacterium]